MNPCANPHSHKITKTKWNIHPSNILGVIIQGDGSRKYVLKCPECQRHLGTPTKSIAAEMIRRGYQPVVIRVRPPINYKPCSYRDCPKPGIDMHHWAPRNVFGYWDCDNWPVSYLCKDHHREWHARMDGYRRNAKRPEQIEAQDQTLDTKSGMHDEYILQLYHSRRLAEPPPEWGTTALDPFYRLQTVRDGDELLLSDYEVFSDTAVDQ
jgi:hypothetical protein